MGTGNDPAPYSMDKERFEMKIDGVYSFERPFENTALELAEKIKNEIHIIEEWRTIMNIFSYKGWEDPLTGDVHIVLSRDKMVSARHIGDAAEIVEP